MIFFQFLEMGITKQISCHWFRKDLRFHDNPSLCEAIANSDEFYAIYILSPLILKSIVSERKKNFLLQSLKQLDENLQKLGSKLIVVQGNLFHVLPFLIKHLGFTKLTFEAACDRYGKQNEKVVEYLARQSGIEVISSASHTLFDIDDVIQQCGESVPVVFEKYLEILSQLKQPGKAYPKVAKVPPFNPDKLKDGSLADQMYDLNNVPMSGELLGGEEHALMKLEEYLEQVV